MFLLFLPLLLGWTIGERGIFEYSNKKQRLMYFSYIGRWPLSSGTLTLISRNMYDNLSREVHSKICWGYYVHIYLYHNVYVNVFWNHKRMPKKKTIIKYAGMDFWNMKLIWFQKLRQLIILNTSSALSDAVFN